MAIGVPRGRHALSVTIVFTCLATCVTAARIYTRVFLVKQMGADDWTILVSLCFWATVPMYQASLITTKASILFQYKRVFSIPRMRFACLCLIGFLAVYGVWTFLTAWLTCVPVEKFWDNSIQGFCFNKKGLWFSNSAIHIFTDIAILFYPMPVLKSLQLPKRQKMALTGVFALGVFVLVTSILRLRSLLVISESTDPTYDNPDAATWSAVECNVAIICASLPSTRNLISRLVPRMFSTRGNGYRTRTTNGYLNPVTPTHDRNFQTSVAADAWDPDLMELKESRETSDAQQRGANYASQNGIKVTTVVSQESGLDAPDEESSVRRLVEK
ncbi:hypothetical protein BBP40_002608 [Aspergillus hancockii]|nr:hypothetical protein BBP40_002608 [Aspergillus hancockii]